MTDTQPHMQIENDEIGFVARWRGGPYIEIGLLDEHCDFQAHDVINVWDYEKDEPRIARTLEAFAERVAEYFAESDEDE